jgi:hypothetical protein
MFHDIKKKGTTPRCNKIKFKKHIIKLNLLCNNNLKKLPSSSQQTYEKKKLKSILLTRNHKDNEFFASILFYAKKRDQLLYFCKIQFFMRHATPHSNNKIINLVWIIFLQPWKPIHFFCFVNNTARKKEALWRF